jgi:DNA-binding transcriptional LysR family regulator
MNLRQIELLRAVIRWETTVRAAREIGLSQPAVSNGIKHLEDQLGFALFERVNNRLFPTPEARRLYEETESLFQMYEIFGQQVRAMKSNRMSSIRLLATPPLGHSVIPAALRHFTERKNNVTVHFDIQNFDTIVEGIEAGAADLGFVVGTGNMADLESEMFFSEPLVCAMPADHPLTRLEVIQPQDLVGHPLIALHPSTAMGTLTRSIFTKAGLPFDFRVEVRYCNTACVLVSNGVGIALVDSLSAMPMVGERIAVRRFLPEHVVTASAIWSPKRILSKVATDFLRDVRMAAYKLTLDPYSDMPLHMDGSKRIAPLLQ